MKAPLSWLREYVTTDVSAHDLARRLSISSLEVERVIDAGVPDVDGNLGRFVVGRVVAADPHPNADKLQLCQVDVGNPEPQQIVCGAWNFGVGATVAVGLPGALLPGFPGPLEERELRGQLSRGMILAEDEVGLGSDHGGIMVLPGASSRARHSPMSSRCTRRCSTRPRRRTVSTCSRWSVWHERSRHSSTRSSTYPGRRCSAAAPGVRRCGGR